MRKKMVVLAILLMVFCSFSLNASSKELKIGHIMNTDHVHHIAVLKFADLVEQKTNGSLTIKIFPNSQLGSALSQTTSVKMGTLDMFIDGTGWYGQLIGAYNITATAYAFKDLNHLEAFLEGPLGLDIAERLRKEHGIRILSQMWHRLPRHLLAVKPVNSIDDLKGMKVRVPELPSYTEPWKAMGGSPTPIAFAEVYLALQQGVVEAMECPVDMIYTQKLHEVAPYLMLTQHQCETAGMIINEELFEGLSEIEQDALYEAAEEAGDYNNKLMAEEEEKILNKMRNEGVNIIEVNTTEFYNLAKDVPFILEEQGLWEKGLYEKVLSIEY